MEHILNGDSKVFTAAGGVAVGCAAMLVRSHTPKASILWWKGFCQKRWPYSKVLEWPWANGSPKVDACQKEFVCKCR